MLNGLELHYFRHNLNLSLVNPAIRYLNGEGTSEINTLFDQAVPGPEESPLQRLVQAVCNSLNLRLNGVSQSTITPPHLLQLHKPVYVPSGSFPL